jgi:F0F1-type ATP synthase assembly protein I
MQYTQNTQNKKLIYALSLGTQFGLLISLPLVFFLVLGIFLDKKFHTFPIFLILGIVLGIVNTFFETYYLILPFLEKKVRKK